MTTQYDFPHQPRPGTVTPTGVERYVHADDVIVSETDTKGLITYANDAFMRVAAYRQDELIGRPHNIVRHPDMPRCVFKLLWDTITTGRQLDAYVLNLAGDGAHYWVLARVVPLSIDGRTIAGFRSERRAPARGAVNAIMDVYGQLLQTERAARSSSEGLHESTAQMLSLLDTRQQTYDEFVRSLA